MGAVNVKLTFATWGSLPATPKLVLVYMALTSLDEDHERTKARRYFAGREALASSLGRDVPPEPEDDDLSPSAVDARKARNAAFVAVRSALQVLKSAGAITVVRRGGFRYQAEYALNLDPWSVLEQGDPAPTTTAKPAPLAQGPVSRRSRSSLPPMSHSGTTEDLGGGQPQLGSSSHQGAASAVRDEEVDPYLMATNALERAGSDRAERLMAQVWADHPEATTRELVMLSADLARGAA